MSSALDGPSGLLADLLEAARRFSPGAVLELDREIADRIRKAPIDLNEYGYDPYGFNPELARRIVLPMALAYRYYFRVETYGMEALPSGRMLVIANHSGQVGYDAFMLGTSLLLDADPPRMARGMAEYFFWRIPWAGVGVSRLGSVAGTPENCARALESGECVVAFPEGARGANHPYNRRYQLERMGLGFMRLALETDTPIVPVGIVGAEEQQPGFANLSGIAERFGLPSLPITVSFPWLGPLGMFMALPVKYHMHFGTPLHFEGSPNDEDDVIAEKVEVVRDAIRGLLTHGLATRRGWFS